MQAEQTTKMTAKLYECRDAARNLLGAHYARDMDLWAMAIRGAAQTDGCSELAAATKMAKETDGFGAIVVLAAFVEMTEPSNVELSGQAAASSPRRSARTQG